MKRICLVLICLFLLFVSAGCRRSENKSGNSPGSEGGLAKQPVASASPGSSEPDSISLSTENTNSGRPASRTAYPIVKWFDYHEDGWSEINPPHFTLTEYPGMVFLLEERLPIYDPENKTSFQYQKICLLSDEGKRVLSPLAYISSAYFCDLNGDGSPEMICSASVGSGNIHSFIVIIDLSENKRYINSDWVNYDYDLKVHEEGFIIEKTLNEGAVPLISQALDFTDGDFSALGEGIIFEESDVDGMISWEEAFANLRLACDGLDKYSRLRIIYDELPNDLSAQSFELTPIDQHLNSDRYCKLFSAVRCLADTLDTYPLTFYWFFDWGDGKSGLRFLLVDDIRYPEDADSFDADAVAFPSQYWYNIAIKTDDMTQQLIHHMLWHSVEQVMEEKRHPIDEDAWMALNPEGFEYSYGFEAYDQASAEPYLLGRPDYDSVYFTRATSIITPKEDRATLIEYILEENWKARERIEYLQSFPHLTAKLDFLKSVLKETFDYVFIDEMH